ncbi:site-specific integrase [Pontibacter diazotrophicus]|uniref:Site-specific integrase n=1 Tax=Pontibacter diazotrophicus TaxID=1400979 RepID=A0A3D8LIC6_9BACT|nr:site-specific integrase [Pontibacter diazotrophicus]RDV17157.1 site-specific integrase [Pontibacter diazotrophicus]
MDTKISILFYGKKAKTTTDNLLPIYLRVTVSGKRFEASTHRYIAPGKWSVEAGRVKGNTEEARRVNAYLDLLRSKVYAYQQELLQEGKPITMEAIKDKWLGVEEKPVMLLEVFRKHNEQVEQLVGKDFAPGTLERYRTSLLHTCNFIKWKYKAEDIDVKKLDFGFISDYEFWLKSVRGCAHNTTMKYLGNFKKVIHICLKNGWLQRDPFLGFKMSKKEVVRSFLTKEELQKMAAREFEIERLDQVRDIFLFSCFTGLAYADVQKLKRSEIVTGPDGGKWIYTSRQKTDTVSRIPLLPTALTILERYSEHPQCLNQDRVLPVLSNQKMNAYLKEIADLCGISKPLTFHIARHTFATTVTLSNGVPIESVSRMLGHTNIKTTQHYAKILDQKVSEDMQLLKDKFKI